MLIALAVIGAAGGAAFAQTARDEAQALADARRRAAEAIHRAHALEDQAVRALDAAARARAEAAAVALRIQTAEADIATASARLARIERLRARQQARIAEKQQPITRLAAALQILTRRPPAAAIAQPGSLRDMVHVRALLSSGLPVIAERTASLRAELAAIERLRRQAGQALTELHTARETLQAERIRLARLEGAERDRSARLSDSAMFEQERAMGLGEKARDIAVLMEELEAQAVIRERLATLPGPLLRPRSPGGAPAPAADAPPPVRSDRPPPYRLPVVGRLVSGLGESDESGLHTRGLTLATAAGAQVVSPTWGRISYAGAFRGYGNIVIIDHGGGWTTLITDLATIMVRVGDVVVRGSPVGRAGPGRPTVTVELRRGGVPVDIARLAGIG
ncbi:metalloendopeptidase [Sphingomonas oleivorans]|uniref:Metalloendopeptidase n=1 Tax=Sphingomonas oleivorans TaxID=1735121 RepID=A0A2T5G306_9SPHN|nr:metalloendopeptidase [Sphingomonas oleivorans]